MFADSWITSQISDKDCQDGRETRKSFQNYQTPACFCSLWQKNECECNGSSLVSTLNKGYTSENGTLRPFLLYLVVWKCSHSSKIVIIAWVCERLKMILLVCYSNEDGSFFITIYTSFDSDLKNYCILHTKRLCLQKKKNYCEIYCRCIYNYVLLLLSLWKFLFTRTWS